MTAAVSWESAKGAFPKEIEELLNSSLDADVVGLKLLAAIPEWEVPLQGGYSVLHRRAVFIGTSWSTVIVIVLILSFIVCRGFSLLGFLGR